MPILAPSLLSADFFNLEKEINDAIEVGADWIHIDVMDFHFVPQLTFGSKIVKDIKNHKDIFCDVHLMVTNPQDHIIPFSLAGADLINFHAETTAHGDRLIAMIKEQNKLAGITINPLTTVESIKHYLPLVDMVLVMSVNPGFSGQSCLPYTFYKITELDNIRKEKNYQFTIQVDGGISLNNVNEVLERGADVIVAGSAFFSAETKARIKLAETIHNFIK